MSIARMNRFTLCMVACTILGLGISGCSNGKNTTTITDTTAPTATSSLSTSAATKGSVTITVNASDNSSGVASITLPSGTVVSASTATYTVSSNGTYDFVIADKSGNTTILPVAVSNIDTTAPTATYSLSTTAPASSITISIAGADAQSGVASITLPDSTVKKNSSAKFDVSANGTYNFVIADAAGNTTIFPVTISNIISSISADSDIQAVTTIGFVDQDGTKAKAIVVKYNHTLASGSVGVDSYTAYSYANLPIVYEDGKANGGTISGAESVYPSFALANGTPGAITKAYVRSTPTIDPNGVGDTSGSYVILELNTDYLLSSAIADWRSGLAGGVEQIVPIVASNSVVISASTAVKSNYQNAFFYDKAPMGNSPDQVDHSYWGNMVFDDTLYTLSDIAGYKLHTSNVTPAHTDSSHTNQLTGETVTAYIPDETVLSMVVGPSIATTGNFSEYDGASHDVSQMYSIFVPADYDASKQYMAVLHIEDAGGLGDDPLISLTESQAPANYASDRVQNLAKGYTCSNGKACGGLIVVVPQMQKADQDVADNLTGNQFLPATWKLMDYITSTYSIDKNRIYASGQSMGGMQALDMAAQRDNYFAAIWSVGSQWGNNYNKTYTYPYDGTIITNPDWQNWYYSISDDNILITNMTGDASSTTNWGYAQTFYTAKGDAIPYQLSVVSSSTTVSGLDKQLNSDLETLLGNSNKLGIWWQALSGGSHKMTWIYAHGISDSYDWLLSQTKASEDARTKLALNVPYASGGTEGFNTVSDAAATTGISASSSSVSVAVGSSKTVALTMNTATSAPVSVSYSVAVTDPTSGNNVTYSDLAVTYTPTTTVANGQTLAVTLAGNVAGSYNVTFTATFGSAAPVSNTILVTVTQ